MPVAFLNQIAAVQGLKPPGISDIVQKNAPAGAAQQAGSALDRSGKGYAKELVRYALNLGRETGMKAVRLDVLEGNVPAERLYSGLGFSCVGMVPMFYEDTGWKNFKAYEYVL